MCVVKRLYGEPHRLYLIQTHLFILNLEELWNMRLLKSNSFADVIPYIGSSIRIKCSPPHNFSKYNDVRSVFYGISVITRISPFENHKELKQRWNVGDTFK